MTPPRDPALGLSAVDQQRGLLDDARSDLRRAAVALKDATAVLSAQARAGREDPAGGQGNQDARIREAREALAAARERASAERLRLRDDLTQLIAPTPDAEVARLSADQPLVLLPVRIETRFAGNDLLLRVYPDEIFADSFEPELTDEEIADGTAFWNTAWPGEREERTAWTSLVSALGAARAAWVADTMTPTNLATRPAGVPAPPPITRRERSWTRPAEARLLPDRWHVLLQVGETERIVSGPAILEPLALTFSPDPADTTSPLGPDGLELSDEVRWTVEFPDAEKVGMALRIPLQPAERNGFKRVLVFGVKSSLLADVSATKLGQLLTHHRHDRGLAIVPQGTPTNNTSQGAAPFPPADPDGRRSYEVERAGLTTPAPGRDGPRWVAALGLPAAMATHLDGADGRESERAAAMARALWPVTWGYFLKEMMAPVFGDDAIESTRQLYVNHVRGRGPVAAFRIGNTPYGVLPITALDQWQSGRGDDIAARTLPSVLTQLRGVWQEHAEQVARIGRTGDPDQDLMETLGLDASTREVRVRPVMGEDANWNLMGLFGLSALWPQWLDFSQLLASQIFTRLGHPEWTPRIGRVNFNPDSWPFRYHLITEEPVSETTLLAPNYIDWIRTADVPALMQQAWPAGTDRPVSLLYRLLRHGALLEYHTSSYQIGLRFGIFTLGDGKERELTGLSAAPAKPSRVAQMMTAVPVVSGTQPIHSFLSNPANAAAVLGLLPNESVVGFRDALAVLSGAPTAELERLLSETLDLASHRLDAWITAMSSRRLEQMRALSPAGCHLGAYGWVEDLRPKPAASAHPVELSEGRRAVRQDGNGGYVHAPSMTHAAAAAVLRNGYLSRTGVDQKAYAVDLSSARVRAARFVLDAVREGQPIGAVFGYQVERGLHDRLLDKYIDPLRARFPLVAAKTSDTEDFDPNDPNQPKDHIAARNVVDGLLLRTASQAQTIPWGSAGFPAAGADRVGIEAELLRLDQIVDAVSDLLLAESVYQLVKGSPSVAAATLDAMARGSVRPPDPEIATQPRRGTPLTHKVVLLAGGDGAALPAGYPALPTPRAVLEPRLDAWLGQLFGTAAQYVCSVEFGPEGTPIGVAQVSLGDLRVRPIDVLLLSDAAKAEPASAATRAPATELDRRVLEVAHTKLGLVVETAGRITYGRPAGFDPAADRCFSDLLELACAARVVIAKSRPLAPEDLVAEDRGDDAKAADHHTAEALARVANASTALDLAGQALAPLLAAAKAAAPAVALDLSALRTALRALAARGVAGAWPVSSFEHTLPLRVDLVAQGESVRKEVARRLDKSAALLGEAAKPAHADDPRFLLGAARDALDILVGAAMPFLPRFDPPVPAELGNALAHASSATFIDADAAKRRAAIRQFEVAVGRVRPALDAWRRLEILSSTLGRTPAPRGLAQLPHDASARWVALPFSDESKRPKPGRTALLFYQADAPGPGVPWAGLLLDQWVETIPLPTEQTGVAFHYDDPGAEAPQAVLVAVPPVPHAETWELSWLVGALKETLDLTKIRAVDRELLGELGQLLPAICLADSTHEVTVRSAFHDALARETMLAQARVNP